jgi:hypothetical protein
MEKEINLSELFKTIGVIIEKSNARLRIALRQSLVWVPN